MNKLSVGDIVKYPNLFHRQIEAMIVEITPHEYNFLIQKTESEVDSKHIGQTRTFTIKNVDELINEGMVVIKARSNSSIKLWNQINADTI